MDICNIQLVISYYMAYIFKFMNKTELFVIYVKLGNWYATVLGRHFLG